MIRDWLKRSLHGLEACSKLGVLTPLPVTDLRQLNIRIDVATAEQLKLMAAAEGLSLNQLVVRVLQSAAEQAPAGKTVLERLAEIESRLDALEG